MIMGATVCALVVSGSRLSPDELAGMYADPEYADTWRYTGDHRYVEEDQWTADSPTGYSDHLFVQNAE
jgi:hypothetical protein